MSGAPGGTRRRAQVLVIGAGPGGVAAGVTLARAGVDVHVVDRAHFPRDKVCGDAVSNDGVTILCELGVDLAGLPHAEVRRAAAVLPGDRRLERTYPSPGIISPRRELDDALRLCLEASGASLEQGVAVRELQRAAGGWLAACDGASWTADLVIAADGPTSVAWASLGRVRPRGRALGVATTAYLEGVSYPHGHGVADHYLEPQLPRGYGWIFPPVNGVANVGVYQRDDALRARGVGLPEQLRRFLLRHPDRFGDARQVGGFRSWPLPLAPGVGPVCGEGILLVGDAGGFVDPLSGEGIWQALDSGRLAGEVAADAVRSGGLDEGMRARYTSHCERFIRRPGLAKRRAQELLRVLLATRLDRLSPVRTALGWAYRRGSLELTKSV